ncbi:MAG: vitamin B12-dependent ribonucleotide reductase [Phycisphaerales bacterium]|nr:vitamin B12-dependent ribonucleotide reductase [Phycisphaerales bacterium]
MTTSSAMKDARREDQLRLTENAVRVLRARYLKKDENGRCLETPEQLFRRVARAIAEPENTYASDPAIAQEWEDRFYRLMGDRRFMPNSPTLMNAGREMGMLSACFVLPVRDSINDIFDCIKWTALIQKAGGGTGFAFDELRPTGDYIASSGGTTSGPISFWKAFSEATNAIQQGAFRRGANMGMMYITHPDILKFLHAKEDLSQFTNYNISVKATDEWMEDFLAEPDGPHIVVNPRTKKPYVLAKSLKIWEYDIHSLTPYRPDMEIKPGEYYTRRDIWDIIVNNAHRTGEPGVVFIDRINEANPTPHVGRIEATNPCGEQPLLPFEACNLGSINLALFIKRHEDGAAYVDWDGLRETVHESTRFLDNVIDANRYPLPQIDAVCKANRKIGLGVMGFADALYELDVPYNSEEGVEWGRRFMKFVDDESHHYSEKLARERGSFTNWEGSIWDTKHHRPMRNSTTTTVAPTGTISIITGCSGGIEPMYSLAFIRNVLRGQDEGKQPMIEVNPIFLRVAQQHGFLSEGLLEKVATEGTLAHIDDVPEDVRRVFVCAHDISPEWHMRMQAAFQEHCDASISKTINFPETASKDDVEKIYRLAYELRCKGVTVYRNGCRKHQPMALKSSDKVHAESAAPAATPAAVKPVLRDEPLEPAMLPEICSGLRIRQLTPFGNMHINVTVDPRNGKELEVFAQLGKGGDLATSDLEAICRMVSLWLRAGGDMMAVVRQLHGIGSSLQVSTKEGRIMSLADGLARALRKYMQAKAQFGLKAMLHGEYDLSDLGKPLTERSPSTAGGSKHGPPHGGNGGAASNGGNGGGSSNGGSSGHAGNGSNGGHENGGAKLVTSGMRGRFSASGTSLALAAPEVEEPDTFKIVCPECQGKLNFVEGCVKCESCGYAQC